MFETIPNKSIMGIAEISCLFHALAGMCLGWIYGSRIGMPAAVAASALGLLFGIATGFLVGRLPRAVQMAKSALSHRHRTWAVIMGAVGSLMAILFWWIGLSFIRG